jgi:hypothetical protein
VDPIQILRRFSHRIVVVLLLLNEEEPPAVGENLRRIVQGLSISGLCTSAELQLVTLTRFKADG